jgi:argininosuccinate lyase
MDQLSVAQIRGVDSRFGEDVKSLFNYQNSVELKCSKGGTSKSAVLEQIEILKKMTQGR